MVRLSPPGRPARPATTSSTSGGVLARAVPLGDGVAALDHIDFVRLTIGGRPQSSAVAAGVGTRRCVRRLPVDSKAQAEQVRSVAVERVGALLGSLDEALVAELDEALRLHLAL